MPYVLDELGVGPIEVGAPSEALPGVYVPDAEQLTALLKSERAAEVRAVVFAGELDPRCADLPALEVVHAATISAEAFVALGQSSAPLRAVRSKIRGTVGPKGFAALADAPAFAKLSVVQLIDPGCGNATRAWFRGSRPIALRSLELPNRSVEGCIDGFTAGGAYDLGAAKLGNLEVLDLENQYLGMGVMSAVARRDGLPRLRRLGLAGTRTTSYLSFIRQRHLPELSALDLHRVFLRADELRHIGRELAPRLERLRLHAIGDAGAEELAGVKMPRLRELRLDCCELHGIEWLSKAKWSPRSLDLSWNYLNDDALASARSKTLESIVLSHNPVTVEGVSAMIDRLPTLRYVDLSVTDDEYDALVERHPEVDFSAD